jgi:hypothetical protein
MEKCGELEAWPCALENTKATNPANTVGFTRHDRSSKRVESPENPTPTLRLVVHAETNEV